MFSNGMIEKFKTVWWWIVEEWAMLKWFRNFNGKLKFKFY